MSNFHFPFSPKASVLLVSAMFAQSAWAETSDAFEEHLKASSIAVTSNPLGATTDQMVTPVAILNGRELATRRESTLGETLNGIPGVSSSYFGPNASRPIIRGIDGDRVRMMQNGVGVLDASALSPDHAVPVDPFIAEQIDVVRGPATVLYGAGAVGGVVNVIDHRIPKEPLDGMTARGEMRFGGADDEKSAVAVSDVGNGTFALHVDGYSRNTNDLNIPGYAKIRELRSEGDKNGRLVNSSADGVGGAIGASITSDHGYAGVSFSNAQTRYGTVAEEAVRIHMDSDRYDAAAEIRDLDTWITRIKFRMAHTDYTHTEIEDGEVGTTFKNKGNEGTLEVAHQDIGLMKGVVGFQFHDARFQALGDEAFVPSTQTDSRALYVFEEMALDRLKLSAGGRYDRTEVSSNGGDRFGDPQQRDFRPVNGSVGVLYALSPEWGIGSNLNHTERAPTQNELYANGPHLATAQYEVGDANLNKERSNGLDVQLRWKRDKHSVNVTAYYTRFQNFINLANTGNTRGVDGELNPLDADGDGVADGSGEDILNEATVSAVKARFTGMEMEGKFHVYEGAGDLDLTLRGDYVRATNLDSGDALPRIPPMRLGFGLDYRLGAMNARFDVLHAFDQERTAENERETDGYTLVNATASYRLPSKYGLEVFAKAKNLLNDEIRDHTSFLKDIAPQGARSLLVGLRSEF